MSVGAGAGESKYGPHTRAAAWFAGGAEAPGAAAGADNRAQDAESCAAPTEYAAGLADDTCIEALAQMANSRKRGWWDRYRGAVPQRLLDVAESEWFARRLRTLQTVHVPGLLQLSGYARAIFNAALPRLPRSEVELRVTMRMQRQQALDRDKPVNYVAHIHEWALRMQFGGRRAMREQLLHIREMSEHDNVEVRVLATDVGAFPGAGHAVLYAEGAVQQLDTVHVDSAHGGEFTHAEARLAKYRAHMDWWSSHCLGEKESRDFVHSIARQL